MSDVHLAGDELPEFVDAHHHLQNLTDNPYPWITGTDVKRPLAGDISYIQRDYLTPELQRDLAGLKLIKSVHIQHGWDPSDSVGETRWLQDLHEKTGLANAIVAFADLSAPDAGKLLEAHAAYPNVRGIRQILKWHPKPELSFAPSPDLADDATWRRGFMLLKRFGMSFDVQVFPWQLGSIARLANDFPDTVLIIGHAGMPVDRSTEGLATWIAGLKALAEQPNVYIKLSGFGLYGGRDWSLDEVGGLMLRIIDIFGTDRCMCASNLPVDGIYAPPGRIVEMIRWIADRSTPSEARRLLRGNAEKAYRI